MKRWVNILFLTMIFCLILTYGSSKNVSVEASTINADSEKVIGQALPFSEGLAWIKLDNEEKWKCINTEGNVVFEEEYGWPSAFIGDFALVENSIVIDKTGNLIYDFKSEGYELVDSRPLDVGCIILQKDIDTFEKSGTFQFVLDVKEKKITEIDFSECAYFTASKQWGEFFKENGNVVRLCDYLGNGYYTLENTDGYEDRGYSASFQMIQWYDVKNNNYINLDSGIEYRDDDLPSTTFYYETSDPDIYGVYIYRSNNFYFINVKTCTIDETIDAYVQVGIGYVVQGVIPEDHVIKCYDNEDDEVGWFLDMDTREKMAMTPEYEEYEVVGYSDGYFFLSLVNDIGTNYIAVVDKTGHTVFQPTQYDVNSKFKPCIWDNSFIFDNGTDLCFTDITNWTIVKQITTENSSDYNTKEYMRLTDICSPDVKYFVDFDSASYYLPDGSEVSVDTGKTPTVLFPGKFENKLLVWNYVKQYYEFLNNDLSPMQIKF